MRVFVYNDELKKSGVELTSDSVDQESAELHARVWVGLYPDDIVMVVDEDDLLCKE